MSDTRQKLRCPTERQYRHLLNLGSGAAGISRTRRDIDPLLKRGWVTADWRPPYYQWVRITAEGLRALALGVERYGLPELTRGHNYVQVCADCEREWRPKCRCGSDRYRYDDREVVRDAA